MRFFNLPFANPFLKGLVEAPLLLPVPQSPRPLQPTGSVVLNTKDSLIHNETFWPTLAIIGWPVFETRSRASTSRRSDTAKLHYLQR